jgi:hypothetical protein
MKTLVEKVVGFIKREWFLMLLLSVIIFILFLFSLL